MSDFTGSTALITGGSGFLGTVICRRLLLQGIRIINFDLTDSKDSFIRCHELYTFQKGDVSHAIDFQPLYHKDITFAIHLAARQFSASVPRFPSSRTKWFSEVNVNGTRNMLTFMSDNHISRMIYFSTDMTYGLPKAIPVSAEQMQCPLGPYGITKLEAEKLIRSFRALNCTIFRPRLILGPGRLGILTKLFTLIRHSLPVPLIGSGKDSYQMVSADDCAHAALLAIEHGFPNQSFNLGSKNPPCVRDLLEAVIRHAQSKSLLLPTPAWAVKKILQALDSLGMSPLYPEQYLIADQKIILDTLPAERYLGWSQQRDDISELCAAYDYWLDISSARRTPPV